MLELAPLFWARTRERLDPVQLANDLGPIGISVTPLDISTPAEQQPPPGGNHGSHPLRVRPNALRRYTAP